MLNGSSQTSLTRSKAHVIPIKMDIGSTDKTEIVHKMETKDDLKIATLESGVNGVQPRIATLEGGVSGVQPRIAIESEHNWSQILQYMMLDVCQSQWPETYRAKITSNHLIMDTYNQGLKLLNVILDKIREILYQQVEKYQCSLASPFVVAILAINFTTTDTTDTMNHKIKMKLVPNHTYILHSSSSSSSTIHPCLKELSESIHSLHTPIQQTTDTKKIKSTEKRDLIFKQEYQVNEQELQKIEQTIVLSAFRQILFHIVQTQLLPITEDEFLQELTPMSSILSKLMNSSDTNTLRSTITYLMSENGN